MMIILITFSGMLGGLAGGADVVYAEENLGGVDGASKQDDEDEDSGEDNEEDVDEELSPSETLAAKGNIYGLGGQSSGRVFSSALENAAKYDIRMQYLITYAFLMDNYGSNMSEYSKLYDGKLPNDGLFPEMETSPKDILSKVTGGHFDNPHNNREDAEGMNPEEYAKLKKKLAKEIGSKISDHVISMLGTSKSQIDELWENKKDDTSDGTLYILVNLKHAKPTKGMNMQINKDIEIDSKLRKDIETFYINRTAERLDNISVKEGMTEEDFAEELRKVYSMKLGSSSLMTYARNRGQRDIEPGMYKHNGNPFLGGTTHTWDGGISFLNPDSKGASRADVFQGIKEGNLANKESWDSFTDDVDVGVRIKVDNRDNISKERFVKLFEFFPEYIYLGALYNSYKHGVEWDEGDLESQLKEVSVPEVQEGAEVFVKENLINDMSNDDELNKLVNEFIEESSKIDIKVEDEERILTWTYLSPYYEDLDDDDKEDLKKYLKKEGSTKLIEGSLYEGDEEKLRPIHVKDLLYSEEGGQFLLVGDNKRAKIRIGSFESKDGTPKFLGGSPLGRYAGMEMDGWFKWSESLTRSDGLGNEGKLKEQNYNIGLHKYIFAYNWKYNNGFKLPIKAKSKGIVGVDSYGNIIDSTSGTILVPYWQNKTIKRFDLHDSNAWASHNIYKNKQYNELKDIIVQLDSVQENNVSKEDIQEAFNGYDIEIGDLENIPASVEGLRNSLITEDGEVNKDSVRKIALAITAGTHEKVQKWNEDFIKEGKNADELFAVLDAAKDVTAGDSGKGEQDDLDKVSDADLKERIMMILDYGFYEVLRLTIAGLIVHIYNSGFIHFAMTETFHTTTIADTDVWEDIIFMVSGIIILLVGIYLLWMVTQYFRNQARLSDILKQFLVATIIILIPTVVYSPLIDTVINKPTPFFLGKQMEQTLILDTFVERERERDGDDTYSYLFIGNEELRDTTQDYVVKFHTNTHRKGFNIKDVDSDSLTWTDSLKMVRANKTGNWDPRDVESVRVSVYDIFDWLNARVDREEDHEEYTDLELFEWLASEHGDRYENIDMFEEYEHDVNTQHDNLRDAGIDVEDIDNYTASEVLVKLYEASSSKASGGSELSDRIQNMTDIAEIVKSKDEVDGQITKEEVESIIRDFSLSRQGRDTAFGTGDVGNAQIKKPNSDTPNVSSKTMETWNRVSGQELIIPENDYLNLETVIDEFNVETGDSREKTNDRIIYDVNRQVLSDYISVQSIVRETVGSDVGESEFLAITLNEFFVLNENLDIKLFPSNIEPDSVTLDTFARMVFIPLHEYSDATNKDLNDLSKYLSLRDNPFLLLLLFVPALFGLVIWGNIYFITFGFLLMLVSVATFFWQYIVKRNMENKSWLGTLFIIGRFALAKIGLLALWFGMSYAMNYSYTRFGGLTYPYTYVHSLIIIVYIVICFKLVFMKTFKQIKDNPGDLGGEVMLSDLQNRFKRRGMGGKGKSTDNKSESAVEKTVKNEGGAGEIARNAVAGIAGTLGALKAKYVGDGLGEVDEISNALDPLGSKLSRRFPKLLKGVGGAARKEMLREYDDIGYADDVDGVSEEQLAKLQENGLEGEILSTNADGNQIGKIEVGNHEQAELLSNHLNGKGIKSWVDEDGNVMFDSQGRDMTDQKVRKSMFGGLMNQIYEQIDEDTKVEENSEENVLGYTETKDGRVKMNIGDKGISTSNVDAMLNSKEFNDAFVLESKPIKNLSGEYIQGTMKVRPRQGVDVDSAMKELFEKDALGREQRGEQERGEVEQNQSISFGGLDKVDNLEKYIKSGMSVQGDKIMYDSNNSKHVSAVSKLKNKVVTDLEGQNQDKMDFVTNLAAQTVSGGNSGFKTHYDNTSNNEELKKQAYEQGILTDGVRSKVFAGDSSERIAKNIEQAKSLEKMDNALVDDYQQKKDNLFREGEKLFVGEDNNYEKGFHKLAGVSKKVGGNSDLVDAKMVEYENLKGKLQNAEISNEEYSSSVEGLYADLQLGLQDQGVYTKAISSEMSKGGAKGNTKKLFDEFVGSKRKLSESGVSVDLIEKMDSNELNDLMDTLDSIQEVKDNGDGTLNIESEGRLNHEDTARIISKMKDLS